MRKAPSRLRLLGSCVMLRTCQRLDQVGLPFTLFIYNTMQILNNLSKSINTSFFLSDYYQLTNVATKLAKG
jgi:hypothetical protein